MKYLLTLLLVSGVQYVSGKNVTNNTSSLLFIENKGQVTDQYHKHRNDIDLEIKGDGISMFIGKGQLHYQFYKQGEQAASQTKVKGMPSQQLQSHDVETYRMDVVLSDYNPAAQLVLQDRQPYYERHYTSGNPQGFTAHAYKKAVYKDIYPGIDWVIYIKGDKVEHEFVVGANADPSQIKIKYSGASSLRVNNDGSLTATTPFGTVTEAAPYSFGSDGKTVASSYRLNGDVLSFDVAAHSGKLTIDPSIEWATYHHGSVGTQTTNVVDMAIDDVKATYSVGSVDAFDIATVGAFQSTVGVGYDAFIVKFDSIGNRIWCTYYGGNGMESAEGITNTGGYLYVTGHTDGNDVFSTLNSHQPLNGGTNGTDDAWLAKFDTSGMRIWGTFYGGLSQEIGLAVTTDEAGNVYMCGTTISDNNISTPGSHQDTHQFGERDGFIAKFDSAGHRIWGTYYGGDLYDEIWSVISDGNGYIYAAGSTESFGFIATPGSHQPDLTNQMDAFLVKFDTAGVRQWGTFYGGDSTERSGDICMDMSGNIYFSGTSAFNHPTYQASPNFLATPGSYHDAPLGLSDIFLAKFTPSGTCLWGTYLGGSGNDETDAQHCLSVDNNNNVYICGSTNSATGIATVDGWQTTAGGFFVDGFVMKLNPNGFPIWGSYYGGTGPDLLKNIITAGNGDIFLSGLSGSTAGISTPGAFQETNTTSGFMQMFIARISDCVIPAQPVAIIGDTVVCPGSNFTLSVAPVTGADNYTWTLPTGWAGSSTTDSITITAGTTGTATITVTANSICASSASQTLNISLYPTPNPVITQNGNVLDAGIWVTYQWLENNNIITGATSQTYTVTQPGTYTVSVTDTNGCTGLSADLPVSTGNVTIENEVNIYPNPTSGNLTISADMRNAAITITNTLGQVMVQEKIAGGNTYTVDFSSQASGLYIVELNNNGTIYRSKLLKR